MLNVERSSEIFMDNAEKITKDSVNGALNALARTISETSSSGHEVHFRKTQFVGNRQNPSFGNPVGCAHSLSCIVSYETNFDCCGVHLHNDRMIHARVQPRKILFRSNMAAKSRWNSNFCVVLAVFLLVFSLALLHSKLGSHPRQDANISARNDLPGANQDSVEKENYGIRNTANKAWDKRFLSDQEARDIDSDDEETANEDDVENLDGFGDDEDKIDEFDIVDEDVDADADANEDDNLRESDDLRKDLEKIIDGKAEFVDKTLGLAETEKDSEPLGKSSRDQDNAVRDLVEGGHNVSGSIKQGMQSNSQVKHEISVSGSVIGNKMLPDTKKQGLSWDHVLGVVRKPFLKRFSRLQNEGFGDADSWEDDILSDFSSDDSDMSKDAFSSDDQPLDESIRNKLEEVGAIEDALLLKTQERTSPLRTGWAPWFDNVQRRSSKSEFSKRDRVVRATADLLNPMNNPLLQDPDVILPSGLTKSDRAIQKAMRRASVDGIPFVTEQSVNLKEEEMARIKQKIEAEKAEALEKTPDETTLDGGDEASLKETVSADNDEDSSFTQPQRKALDKIEGNLVDAVEYSERKKRKNAIGMLRGSEFDALRRQRKQLFQQNDLEKNNFVNGKLRVTRKLNSIDLYNLEVSKNLGFDKVPAERGASKVGYELVSNKDVSQGIESRKHAFIVKKRKRKHKAVAVDPAMQSGFKKKILKKDRYREWGYFPGLDPFLPFSEFMDVFFNSGNCSHRAFMAWTTPSWTYTVRYKRSLESLLHFHPRACVAVLSDTLELNFFTDFVKAGYRVAVVFPNLDELLLDTPAHVFADIWLKWRKMELYYIHYTELLRLAVLYKYGGVYIDSDVIVLKPLNSLSNTVGVEFLSNEGVSVNGAVMIFDQKSPFLLECLKEYTTSYDGSLLRWNGAELLQRVAKKYFERSNNPTIRLKDHWAFFPLSSRDALRYLTAPKSDYTQELQDMLLAKILNESFTMHFWNGLTASFVPETGSLVERIINYNCLHCTDVL